MQPGSGSLYPNIDTWMQPGSGSLFPNIDTDKMVCDNTPVYHMYLLSCDDSTTCKIVEF